MIRKELTAADIDAIAEYAFNQVNWVNTGFTRFSSTWNELPEETRLAYRAMVKSTIKSLIEHVEPEDDRATEDTDSNSRTV